MRTFLVNGWAEAVFHVLAHARATAQLAASAYDPDYIALIAGHLGPAEDRPLAEDAAVLGRMLASHEALVAAQRLAWLFRAPERAAAVAGRDLVALGPEDVDAPALLRSVQQAGDAAEILRAAAELEAPLLARLPPPGIDLGDLAAALAEVAPAAPRLAISAVGALRPLGRRGRVLDREIWVGVAPIEHLAWQAAHEATVAEVAEALRARGEAPAHARAEGEALALLEGRARAAGLTAAHRAWRAHLDPGRAAVRSGA